MLSSHLLILDLSRIVILDDTLIDTKYDHESLNLKLALIVKCVDTRQYASKRVNTQGYHAG